MTINKKMNCRQKHIAKEINCDKLVTKLLCDSLCNNYDEAFKLATKELAKNLKG